MAMDAHFKNHKLFVAQYLGRVSVVLYLNPQLWPSTMLFYKLQNILPELVIGIGVSNVDFTYQSNGNAVSFSPIPWASGYPTSSGIECVSGNSQNNEWLSRACDTTYGYTICELSS